MVRKHRQHGGWISRSILPLLVVASSFIARDAPARAVAAARVASDLVLGAAPRAVHTAAWASDLAPIEVVSMSTKESAQIRLYDELGNVDDEARAAFERIAARQPEPHALAPRLVQLAMKAAYHFRATRLIVVSAWRERAHKHGTGEALDFKLAGVSPYALAAYLRGLPRAGVGLYTDPDTQFVHVDVRAPSYHWVDASPPGVHWRERPLHDPRAEQRDEAYAPESDLPL